MDTVSVIVPAFNAETSLRRCLDSIFAQSYPHFEVIVVNDGSIDNTSGVAAEYAQRIVYMEQANQGETAARNKGISAASGKYITFIDHDDFWEPGFISQTVQFLREHPDAIGVSVAVEHRSALKTKAVVRPKFLAEGSPGRCRPEILRSFFDFWADYDHICAGSAMLRADIVRASCGQRTDLVLSGDMEFWAYLATFGPWGFIPEVLLHVDGTQVSKGRIYGKFHARYLRCGAFENWSDRINGRLAAEDRPGFDRILARVALGYIFAYVFVGRDQEAFQVARDFRRRLEGRYGQLWSAASSTSWAGWKLVCGMVRVRTCLQYWLAERRLQKMASRRYEFLPRT